MFKYLILSCAAGAIMFASSMELYARAPGGGRGGRSGGASRSAGGRSGGSRSGGFSGGRTTGGIQPGGFSGSVKPGGFSGGARPQSQPLTPGRSNVSPLGGAVPGNFNLPGTGQRPGGLGDRSPRSLNPTQTELQNFLGADRSPGTHRPGDVEGRRDTAATAHTHAQHWQQHAGEIAHHAHQSYHANNFPFAHHWAHAHPYAAKYGWAVHGYHPLTTATWAAAVAWTGNNATGSYGYGYPATVVYQEGDVYIDGQEAGSAATYSQQAAGLATAGAQAKAAPADEWLPLGVFAVAPDKVAQPIALAQLAVNKAGVIEGAYYDTISDSMQPIQGSVDAKTGRAAWSVAGNQKATFETTLQALTRDNGPLLLHVQGNQLQHWTLARMKK